MKPNGRKKEDAKVEREKKHWKKEKDMLHMISEQSANQARIES